VYQKLIIIGNLGRDPEMRYLPSGTPVTNLSVATNEAWLDQDGNRKERTTWFRVSVWGKQAEACAEYLTKGRQVLVEGRLIPDENGGPRVWVGQDGQARASFEVRALNVRFLGGRGERAAPEEEFGGPPLVEEEDIPF